MVSLLQKRQKQRITERTNEKDTFSSVTKDIFCCHCSVFVFSVARVTWPSFSRIMKIGSFTGRTVVCCQLAVRVSIRMILVICLISESNLGRISGQTIVLVDGHRSMAPRFKSPA